MSLFRRSKSLHEQHAAAHAIGQRARNIFHSLADELEQAAHEHAAVAINAQAQINDLSELRDSAGEAAGQAVKQADAVRSLVS